ncbi:carbohydrate ABC transporter substrate-binding protein, partial [Streptacidiphilus sp. ASG 303]|nr:carbohydrate ABC transporter substrate-binding protein [Streptacidiphilus sp. ASG 303]
MNRTIRPHAGRARGRTGGRTRTVLAVTAATALALTAAGCSSGGGGGGTGGSGAPSAAGTAPSSSLGLPDLHGKSLSVAAIWTGPEQATFKKVLDDFAKRTGATATYVPTGDNVSAFLGSKVQGGAAPDVAFLPQVGV